MTDIAGPEAVLETEFDHGYTVTIVTHSIDQDTGSDMLNSFVYTVKANTPTNASMFAQALCVVDCKEDDLDWQMMFVASVFKADMEAEETRDVGSLLPDQVDEEGNITFYSVEDEVIDVALVEDADEEKPVAGGLFDFSS